MWAMREVISFSFSDNFTDFHSYISISFPDEQEADYHLTAAGSIYF
jgi:hypothetical protein